MKQILTLAILFACAYITSSAQATILDDFNSGNIITDFEFDDAMGTQIPDLVNSAAGGGSFDLDTDNDDVVTDGSGHLDASGKANTDFGSNYLDVDGISDGRVIALFDVNFAFEESVYDPGQDEEFRLTLVQFDPRSTFVTAEIFFTRTSATEVELVGNAVGTGAVDTPAVIFGSSASLLTMMDVNLNTDTFEIFYSTDAGASFISGGTGVLDPARGVESVRLVLNEDFSDDRLLIERFAVSHIIPEPATLALMGLGFVGLAATRRR